MAATVSQSVLLVDGFSDEAEMYREYLAAAGFTVAVCSGPEEALEHATRQPPDVVVTRLRQPGSPMTGFDLVTRLKTHDATRNVPVVMFTSSILPKDAETAQEAGCDAYLVPVMPDVLASEIRRVLASRSTPAGCSQ